MKQTPAIHLHYQPRKTKKKGLVENYSLAYSYRKDGKNQKKAVFGLGELSKGQAETCRELLRLLNQSVNGSFSSTSLAALKDIKLTGRKQFMDCVAIVALWRVLKLDKVIPSQSRETDSISTSDTALILVANRLLLPKSKIATVPWFEGTLFSSILSMTDPSKYNSSKIYRELSKIHRSKLALEKYFASFSTSELRREKKASIYYFDGTTTWFEGSNCKLSENGKEKTRGYHPQTLGFMMMTDNLGYPVAWEVVGGKQTDTTCFLSFAKRVKQDFNISQVTFCFDRGVASDKNFKFIADGKFNESQYHFISGLRDDQIKKHFDIEKFLQETRPLLIKEAIKAKKRKQRKQKPATSVRKVVFSVSGFLKYSSRVFYKDLGHKVDGFRYILSFNADIYDIEETKIDQSIEATIEAVQVLNLELALAKRDREFPDKKLEAIFSKLKTSKFFTYSAIPIVSQYESQSFRIELKPEKDAVKASKATCGLLLFVTNHVDKKKSSDQYVVHASDIIDHYRAKHVVENSFRELKSFLKLRPVHVWTEDHVKAHFDIATIAYFINNYIYRKLSPFGVSIRDFYKELNDHSLAVELATPRGSSVQKFEQPSDALNSYFQTLGITADISSVLQAATLDK